MGQLFKLLTSSAWLLLSVVLAVQSAHAQKGYPPADGAWDATDYRALVERVENKDLELPTLSGEAPVFERMVHSDNIPLRMGQNPKLAVTVRYQKLEPILRPLQELITLYSNEAQKGKPYSTEIARLMVYRAKAAGALLEIGDSYLATLRQDSRYRTHVALLGQMKDGARDLYSSLVKSMAKTDIYSKSDILEMTKGAFNQLSSYHPVLSKEDRQDLAQTLTQQISATSDQELQAALTELRDAIKHSRIPT